VNTLCIDAGNSRLKAGLFVDGELTGYQHYRITDGMPQQLARWVGDRPVALIGAALVGRPDYSYFNELAGLLGAPFCRCHSYLQLPFTMAYETPETLGTDRLAAAAGAFRRRDYGPLLILDLGSALTFDLIDPQNRYLGGGIAPGLRLRYEMLLKLHLPFTQQAASWDAIGNSTQASIRTGVQEGLLGEMQHHIDRFCDQYGPDLQTLLTGGDAPVFAKHLKNLNFEAPHLVLEGVDAMLAWNREHFLNAQSNT
jgi:type III pantothenate kinase